MFTGIVEETGRVLSLKKGPESCVVTIECEKVLEGTKIGDSIAVNGICLTVTGLGPGHFTADVMNETLSRSSLGEASGRKVNLERAMAAGGRFGGHLVTGHIDGTGNIRSLRKDGNAVWFTVSAPAKILRYIVEKGSVAVDGISLTVADTGEDFFRVSVIPHTLEITALGDRREGSTVNLENDIIGKYVEKLCAPAPAGKEPEDGGITMEFLAANGF